jgi:ABC-type Fe3+/spermidine/putrescine transport system ATPase subunit
MSDEVIVMNKGEIAQAGAPGELYRYPNSRFVAEFLGQANVIPARIEEARATEVAVRLTELDGAPRLIAHRRPGQAASVGDNVDLFIRPESFTLAGEGGGDQHIQVEVVGREFLGSRTEVSARSGGTAIKFELVSYAEIAPGDRVTLEIGPQAIAWAPAS